MSSITQVEQSLLEKMQQLSALAGGQAIKPAAVLGEPRQPGIGESFEAVLRAIDADQHRASAARAAVSSGRSDDLIGAMIESQKASVSFSALLQVRNKLSTAFDDIMRMSV